MIPATAVGEKPAAAGNRPDRRGQPPAVPIPGPGGPSTGV